MKIYRLLYTEKIDLECPSEEEKWIIMQYNIIALIHKIIKEAINNEQK